MSAPTPRIILRVERGGATGRTSFSSRSRVICRCCSAASASSASGSFRRRARSASSISCALLPVALIRKSWPNRSSYSRLPRSSASRISSLAPAVPACSPRAHAEPPRSPIRGCAANASSRSSAESPAHTSSEVSSSASKVANGRPRAAPWPTRASRSTASTRSSNISGVLAFSHRTPNARQPSSVTRPCTRSRATPPSGWMFSRTWVAGAGGSIGNANRRCGPSGRRESTSDHPGSASGRRRPAARGRVERAGVGVVALEVRRVDLDALDLRLGGQSEHDPVVTLATPAPRLPPVVHAVRVARRDQVVRRREEQVARVQHESARERTPRASVRPPASVSVRRSGSGSPCTRSRATPPSGKIVRAGGA